MGDAHIQDAYDYGFPQILMVNTNVIGTDRTYAFQKNPPLRDVQKLTFSSGKRRPR